VIPLLTDWNMFLYWNNPSLAICDFLRSTHSSRYLNMIGSRTLSLQLYAHFLFLNTSYRVSRALPGLPTSKNSENSHNTGKLVAGRFQAVAFNLEIVFVFFTSMIVIYLPLARFNAFSGLWLYLDMISARRLTQARRTWKRNSPK